MRLLSASVINVDMLYMRRWSDGLVTAMDTALLLSSPVLPVVVGVFGI